MSRTGGKRTNALVGALALLLALLGVALALVIAYPAASRALFVDAVTVHPSLTVAVGRIDALADAIAERAKEGWEHRFVGAYRALTSDPQTVTVDEVPEDVFPERECAECHPYFRERPLFSVVYFSHESHAAQGARCDRCHAARGPTRCMPPAMSGCGECHRETSDGASCNMCHPYGSLFHGAALAGDREIGEQCVTCHPPALMTDGAREMGLPAFDTDPDSCRACHETTFCGGCHPSGHTATYARRHAAEMRRAEVTPMTCYECHSPAGCAGCHARRR